MQLQEKQSVLNLHYTLGLFTTNAAMVAQTVKEMNFVSSQTKLGSIPTAQYSNDKFSFFIQPDNQTITFQILGKVVVGDIIDDIAKVMISLGLYYTPGNLLRIEFSTKCNISDNEFSQFQTIFSKINTSSFQKIFCADTTIDYNALKLRTQGKNTLTDITFSLLSPTLAQFDFLTQFNNEEEFRNFIKVINGNSIEEIINAIINV